MQNVWKWTSNCKAKRRCLLASFKQIILCNLFQLVTGIATFIVFMYLSSNLIFRRMHCQASVEQTWRLFAFVSLLSANSYVTFFKSRCSKNYQSTSKISKKNAPRGFTPHCIFNGIYRNEPTRSNGNTSCFLYSGMLIE